MLQALPSSNQETRALTPWALLPQCSPLICVLTSVLTLVIDLSEECKTNKATALTALLPTTRLLLTTLKTEPLVVPLSQARRDLSRKAVLHKMKVSMNMVTYLNSFKTKSQAAAANKEVSQEATAPKQTMPSSSKLLKLDMTWKLFKNSPSNTELWTPIKSRFLRTLTKTFAWENLKNKWKLLKSLKESKLWPKEKTHLPALKIVMV